MDAGDPSEYEGQFPNAQTDSDIRITDSDIRINEALPTPPYPHGDSNGDGFRDAHEGEFVEIVNAGDSAVDISGYAISFENKSSESEKFKFPNGITLEPGKAAVVFGGGKPTDLGSVDTGGAPAYW